MTTALAYRRRRRPVAAVLAGAALLATACGGGGDDPVAGTAGRSAAGVVEAGEWATLPPPVADPAPAGGEPAALAPLTARPPGDPVAEPGPAGDGVVVGDDPGVGVAEPKPCRLLDAAVLAAWAGRVPAALVPLEAGTACGLATSDDSARVALAVARSADPAASWVTAHPVPESDTLTVALGGDWTLVVEVSARSARPAAERRALAEAVAAAARRRLAADGWEFGTAG